MLKSELVLQLKEEILAKRPVLRDIFDNNSQVSIKNYTAGLIMPAVVINCNRKQEFIAALSIEAGRNFSNDVVSSLISQMEKYYFISTAEHHGPLTHPFFVHSNLLTVDQGLENNIILAVGNVSMNNSSYPRGLIFHTADGSEHKISFFSARHRLLPVIKHAPLNLEHLIRTKDSLNKSNLNRNLAEKLTDLVERIYNTPEILAKKNYSDQITVSNSNLWQAFFSRSNLKMPRLIMLQLENIVLDLLKKHHLFSKTEISELFFNSKIRDSLKDYFDGIPGNFSLKEKKGTFLFWALQPHINHRQQLWPEGDFLRSEEGYSVELKPEAILLAIERGELIPSMFLCSVLVSEYYGVKCLGGFSQSTYLTAIHQGYNKMFNSSINKYSADHTNGVRSDFVLGYFVDTKGGWQAASGIDLALHNSQETWASFAKAAEKLNLEESMMPLFPSLYRELYPVTNRNPNVSNLTVNDIIDFYGLKNKLDPFINIE